MYSVKRLNVKIDHLHDGISKCSSRNLFHFPLPTPNGRSVEIPRGGERGLKSYRFVNESMKLTWNFRRFGESKPTNLPVGGVGRV